MAIELVKNATEAPVCTIDLSINLLAMKTSERKRSF